MIYYLSSVRAMGRVREPAGLLKKILCILQRKGINRYFIFCNLTNDCRCGGVRKTVVSISFDISNWKIHRVASDMIVNILSEIVVKDIETYSFFLCRKILELLFIWNPDDTGYFYFISWKSILHISTKKRSKVESNDWFFDVLRPQMSYS